MDESSADRPDPRPGAQSMDCAGRAHMIIGRVRGGGACWPPEAAETSTVVDLHPSLRTYETDIKILSAALSQPCATAACSRSSGSSGRAAARQHARAPLTAGPRSETSGLRSQFRSPRQSGEDRTPWDVAKPETQAGGGYVVTTSQFTPLGARSRMALACVSRPVVLVAESF